MPDVDLAEQVRANLEARFAAAVPRVVERAAANVSTAGGRWPGTDVRVAEMSVNGLFASAVIEVSGVAAVVAEKGRRSYTVVPRNRRALRIADGIARANARIPSMRGRPWVADAVGHTGMMLSEEMAG